MSDFTIKKLTSVIESMKELIVSNHNEVTSRLTAIETHLFKEEPKKETKKKTKVLAYGDNIQRFFDDFTCEYNKSLEVTENVNRLCEEADINIKIFAGDTVVYHCDKVHKTPMNFKIDKNEVKKITNPKMNHFKLNNKEITDNINAVEGATKNNFIEACKLLNFNETLLCPYKIRTKIIKNTFKNVALEKMTEEETYVNQHAYGPTIYLKEKNIEIDNAYLFDINSFHPYVLSKDDFIFPVRAGKAVTLESIDDDVIGIYAIAIKDQIKYFLQQKEDPNKVWHSNYMIKLLKQENIQFKLLQPIDGYNAIIYDKTDCVKSSDFFGDTINTLYRERKNPVCKNIIQALFGTMITKEADTKTKSEDDLTVEDLENLKEITENSCIIKLDEQRYKYDCARMCLFFYDYCRVHLFNTYLKQYDPIRIYTDSFLIEAERYKDIDLEVSNNLGGVKVQMKLTDVVYPSVAYSFESNPQEGVFFYDKEKAKFIKS